MASEEATRTFRLFGRTVFELKTVIEVSNDVMEMVEAPAGHSFGFEIGGHDGEE